MTIGQYYTFNSWCYSVADTNPSTKVFDTTRGDYFDLTDSTIQSWMNSVPDNGWAVTNARDNGSGAVRLDLVPNFTSSNSASQGGAGPLDATHYFPVYGIAGATGGQGFFQLTLISYVPNASATVDLVGSTFGGTYTSGGQLAWPIFYATAAALYADIASYAEASQAQSGYSSVTLSASPTQLTSFATTTVVATASGGETLKLMNARLTTSPPLGKRMSFSNSNNTNQNFILKDSAGTTIVTVPLAGIVDVFLVDNSTTAGTWKYVLYQTAAASTVTGALGTLPLPVGNQIPVGNTNGLYSAVGAGDLTINGGNLVLQDINGVAIAPTSYAMTDQSGAALSLTGVSVQQCQIGNMMHVYGTVTYPSTANGSNATLSLPVAVPNQTYAKVNSTSLTATGLNLVMQTVPNSSTALIKTAAGVQETNANLSTLTINFMLVYPVA